MSFEYHHLDKWGYANLDLCEEILETRSKAVVLISGASSSGKTFTAAYLKSLLEASNHHALVLSLDQYNIGLSGIIPNKVNANLFQDSLPHFDTIKKRIKDIIVDVPFDQKYADPVLKKIGESISSLLPNDTLKHFLEGLSKEWKLLNFDEPSVYDLAEAARDILALVNNQKVSEKLYSKIVSERVPSKAIYDGSEFDIVIVEGIYALNPLFLQDLHGVSIVKDFIDGNPKSLFLRRIIRDVKMTSSSSAFTTKIYFKYIVKSYHETILPCRSFADVILNNNISFSELRAGDLYTTRDNIAILNPNALVELKAKGDIESVVYEKDFYFVAPEENQEANNILRFREVSKDQGKTYVPFSLVHKGAPKVRKDNKIVRPINVLLDESGIGSVWADEQACLNDFLKAGFTVSRIEKKIKTKLSYQGQQIALFEVAGKNSYLEFSLDKVEPSYSLIRAMVEKTPLSEPGVERRR